MSLFMIPVKEDLAVTFRECLVHLKRLAEANATSEAAIAVHAKNNVRGSAIEDVLGTRDTERLLKGSVDVGGILLHLVTAKNQGSLQRGPLVAAYVSPWLLTQLLRDERATDVIVLPWTKADESACFYDHSPTILSPPGRWRPPPAPTETTLDTEDHAEPTNVRDSLTPEERVLPLEHTIDPGFVNHRRIETIIGSEGQEAIGRAIERLPPLPEGLRAVRVARIYSDVMLHYCRTTGVPPLGKLLAEGKGRIFCSTEVVGPCRNLFDVVRAVNRWRPPGRRSAQRVEFCYSTGHITSDTLRSELRNGELLSIIAELHSMTDERVVFHPLVMGGPWLTSRDPRWEEAAMWWGRDFYENFIEDIDEFSAIRKFPKPLSCEPMKEVSELAFKQCLAEIIGGSVPKDWGGESSDFYTSHLHLGGRRLSGAFLLKGPARFSPMRLNTLGKNNDQIVRLSTEPVDMLLVQHCHEITSPVRATLRVFAVQPCRPRRYCLIDGRDSLWLLQAYGLYERAVELSAKRKGGR